MSVQSQHVHVGLLRQLQVRFQQLVTGRVQEEFAAVIGAAHEHRPACHGEGPALGPRL